MPRGRVASIVAVPLLAPSSRPAQTAKGKPTSAGKRHRPFVTQRDRYS